MSAPQVPAGAAQEPGTRTRAVVLDINKRDGIVDLSMQPHLLQQAEAAAAAEAGGSQPKKKKQKKGAAPVSAAGEQAQVKEGQQLEVTIELVSPPACPPACLDAPFKAAVHVC